MPKTIDRRWIVSIAMVTILMIAIAVLNHHNTVLLYQNTLQVDEAHKIIDLTTGILLGLVDTETGERGFLLTGNEEFLKPYTQALPRITARLAELAELTKGNPSQQAQIHKLDQLANERLALLKERIEMRQKRARDAGAAPAAFKGKDQMDAIRALISEMELEERELLEQRNFQSGRAYHIAITTGLVAALAGLVFLGAFVSLLNRNLMARQTALANKDEFLAMLAHELRNPLAPIRNSLQIMKQPGADKDLLSRGREIAERQVEHMARLLDDLLDVSRISRGRIELRNQPVDVGALIHKTVEAAQPFIDERGHELQVNVSEEPLQVFGDPMRLEQVLTNLLNNAAKYTDPGGKIWLSAQSQDGQVVLSVRDNGQGISADMLPNIFELFFQAQRRGDRTQGGIGIGLTLVRKLVELHKGEVEASSPGAGQGSEFVVRLPVLSRKPQPVQVSADGDGAALQHRAGRRILVVDDNTDAAESLAMLLKLKGHDVCVAFEGHTALVKAQEHHPEFIFLDIGMPAMDGYEVATRLRKDLKMRDATLVALTGWGQESDRQRSRAAGFDHHLVKPVDPNVLGEILAN